MGYKYDIGDRVVIISKCETIGEHGKVTEKWMPKKYEDTIQISVKLDNGEHKVYSINSLMPEDKYKHVVGENLIKPNYSVALVIFIKNSYDTELRQFALYDVAKPGDYVICDNAGGYTIAIIKEILTYEEAIEKGKIPTKEIICVCDFSSYEKRKSQKQKAILLKAQMDNRLKQIPTIQMYEAFSEKDAVLKYLLQQYKGVINENNHSC